MSRILKELGKVYKGNEPTISFEFNLEDLYWLQSEIYHTNGFQKDIQDGIDTIEKHNEIVNSTPYYGLSIVLIPRQPN